MLTELKTWPAKDREDLKEYLTDLLSRVDRGEIKGLSCVVEDKHRYEYKRIGLSYIEALGMHQRALHDLNKQWDAK